MQVEKENPNLITVFICFLRSGLRFTRYDTNNVGLAFIEEIKKHNPNFKPVKVQQRERDQIYTVNAYPKEFEQLIMSLIEEYRIKHKLEYRLKKPKGGRGRGNFNRNNGGRSGGYNQNRDQRGSGGYSRPRRDDQDGSYKKRADSDGYLEGGYHPRKSHEESDQRGYRPRRSDDNRGQRSGGYRPRRDYGGQNRDGYSSDRPNRGRGDGTENKRPRRPRRDSSD